MSDALRTNTTAREKEGRKEGRSKGQPGVPLLACAMVSFSWGARQSQLVSLAKMAGSVRVCHKGEEKEAELDRQTEYSRGFYNILVTTIKKKMAVHPIHSTVARRPFLASFQLQ